MTIDLKSVLASARVVSLPLRTRFRGVDHREALIFEGSEGWAEWSPFLEYESAEAAVWLEAALDWAYLPQPKPVRTLIGVNATLPAVEPNRVEETLRSFGKFNTVKIKVAERGESLSQDLARIAAVHRLYPNAKLRLDANGGYSPEQALGIIGALRDNRIETEYLEQPCASVDELVQLRKTLKQLRLPNLVAADESLRKAADPLEVANAGGADLLVLKAAPLGGVSAALGIASEAGLPAVVSSALETSIGLAMGLHLAACLPESVYDNGLGTAALLAADVIEEPVTAIDGSLQLRRPEPSERLLAAHAASAERTEWWHARLRSCWELLQG